LRLIDPRKLYSILRPGSINRLIVNNPNNKAAGLEKNEILY